MEVRLLEALGMSLVLTVVLEIIFAVVVGICNKRDFLLICLVNVITNPVVVLTYYLVSFYTTLNVTLIIIMLELMAILIEAHYFKAYGALIRHPLSFAIYINLFSYGVGKVIGLIY